MAYTAPTTVVAGQTYSAAAHNVIVNDIIDHESRIKTGIESYTTVARDALTGVATGTMIYNSTEKQVQVYNGSSWIEINDIDNTNGVPSGLAPFFNTWASYAPTISQGATTNIATSYKQGGYIQIGKTVFGWFRVTMSGSGTAGSNVTFSLPVTQKNEGAVIGSAWIYDDSTATRYASILEAASGPTLIFVGDWSSATGWGSNPSIAIASGDQFRGHFTYEAL